MANATPKKDTSIITVWDADSNGVQIRACDFGAWEKKGFSKEKPAPVLSLAEKVALRNKKIQYGEG